ncbi:hypothetical protein A1D29_04250 [Pasteurellaceae bacterium Orientalotternb1]|nr:hypothetical protein A1D29_04250 [Pasteurellaceae bacterium Orientalotternb1]
MNKHIAITLLATTIGLAACSSVPSTNTGNTTPPSAIPMNVINKAEQLTHSGQAKEALALVMPYAQHGDMVAEGLLGYIYDTGLKDKAEAIKWLKKSAQKGDSISQYNLANIYYGMGDYSRAYDYYYDSAKQSYPSAVTQVGVLYYYGEGVDRNYRESAKYFQKAVDLGDKRAYYFLGLSYMESHGVAQDLNKAAELMLKAKEYGIVAADKKLKELGL